MRAFCLIAILALTTTAAAHAEKVACKLDVSQFPDNEDVGEIIPINLLDERIHLEMKTNGASNVERYIPAANLYVSVFVDSQTLSPGYVNIGLGLHEGLQNGKRKTLAHSSYVANPISTVNLTVGTDRFVTSIDCR